VRRCSLDSAAEVRRLGGCWAGTIPMLGPSESTCPRLSDSLSAAWGTRGPAPGRAADNDSATLLAGLPRRPHHRSRPPRRRRQRPARPRPGVRPRLRWGGSAPAWSIVFRYAGGTRTITGDNGGCWDLRVGASERVGSRTVYGAYLREVLRQRHQQGSPDVVWPSPRCPQHVRTDEAFSPVADAGLLTSAVLCRPTACSAPTRSRSPARSSRSSATTPRPRSRGALSATSTASAPTKDGSPRAR
jgi:hypothetical protein